MTDKKILAVVGATGAQGGGLARAILDDWNGPFAVRALTRDPESTRAKELAARGAEVVGVDLGSEESLEKAFAGAYGAFVVTNSHEPLTPGLTAQDRVRRELEQGASAVRAAKRSGIKHLIWSSLEDTRPHFQFIESEIPTLAGKYKVPHLDAKHEIAAMFEAEQVPTTFLDTSFYYENFINNGLHPRRDPDGLATLSIPIAGSTMALVGAEDIGRTAFGIFGAGSRYIGRSVGLAGTHATGAEIASLFEKVLGERVVYRPITHDQMRAAGFAGAEELGNMFQFFTDASDSLIAHRDLDRVRAINPRLQTLEDWLIEHRKALKELL